MATGSSYSITLGHSSRTLEFIYTPDQDDCGTIIAIINNTANSTSLSIAQWLAQNAPDSYRSFNLATYSGNFKERLALFLAFIRSTINNPQLAAILGGNYWVDLDIDWYGFK